MVAIVGRVARMRWASLKDEKAGTVTEQPVRSRLEALLEQAPCAWGFLPHARTRMVGGSLPSEPLLAPRQIGELASLHLPDGVLLVAVEVSTHAWAALEQADDVTAVDIEWTLARWIIPGIAQMPIARPFAGPRHFDLRWPPPQTPEEQIPLSKGGEAIDLATQLRDGEGWLSAPLCRYGVLEGGSIEWLDVVFDRELEILPALTRRFRQRLALFGEALAALGIPYEDHVDYAGYELSDALEDMNAAPAMVSVSASDDLEERRDRALREWDPEDDIFGSTHGFRPDLTRIPGHTVTTCAAFAQIAGYDEDSDNEQTADPEEWLEAAIEQAAVTAGLVLHRDGWHGTLSLPEKDLDRSDCEPGG